jgi:hypothetical protein
VQVHVFRAAGRVFGATPDEAGLNLPTDLGTWNHFKTISMTRGVPVPGLHVEECLDDIERFGFHVTDAHVRITDRYAKGRD